MPDRFMELLNQIVASEYGQEKAEQVLNGVMGELEKMVFMSTTDRFQKQLNKVFYPFIAAYHVLQNKRLRRSANAVRNTWGTALMMTSLLRLFRLNAKSWGLADF